MQDKPSVEAPWDQIDEKYLKFSGKAQPGA